MKWNRITAALVVLLLAFGCAEQRGPKETVGGLTGAALGGLLGAQFGSGRGQLATTATGVLIGALIGSEIGASMDEVDRLKANEAVNKAHSAPLGETIAWNNPDSGNSGTVTPLRDGVSESGQYCREFQQSVTIGGRTEEAFGIACQQPDDTWRIVQS